MTHIRKSDGSIRKENPAITVELENTIFKFRTAINRAQTMESLKDHPGWGAIQEVLNEKIAALDRSLDEFKKNEHRDNDLMMQERRDFRFFLGIVDDFVGSIAGFEQKIEQAEKALRDRKREPEPVPI